MFGNEEEYKNPLIYSMRISIVNHNVENIDLGVKIQEKILFAYKKKIEFSQVGNPEEIFKYKELNKNEEKKGLIIKTWINLFISLMPSTIILLYKIDPKLEKETEYKNIYQNVEKIYNNGKCSIILIVIYPDSSENNQLYLNFDSKERPFYLKNFLSKDLTYMFTEEKIWKYKEFDDICKKIYLSSRHFYKKYKTLYKEKRSKSKTREDKIEYDIKLFLLSSIKTKKESITRSKYLEEAYEMLCDKNFEISNYKYISNPVNLKAIFYEIRAVGDWVFFKLNKNQQNSQQNNPPPPKRSMTVTDINKALKPKINLGEEIKKWEKHLDCFLNKKYFNEGMDDPFHIVEYFWLSKRYKTLYDYIKANIKEIKLNRTLLLQLISVYLKQIFNEIRINKFYKKIFEDKNFDISTININNKIIEIKDVEEESCLFYGKAPIYYIINKDDDNKKQIIGFNEEIYIKKFLSNNKIENNLDKYLSNALTYANLISKDKKENDFNIYINILNIIVYKMIDEKSNIDNINDILYSFLYEYNILFKFPKIHMRLIEEYIQIQYKKIEENAQPDRNSYYKTEIFKNLSKLGNLRKLKEDEEKKFFNLLNEAEFTPTNKENKDNIIVNLNYYNEQNINIIKQDELAFKFDYTIKDIEKNQERKILDIIEYEIKFESKLSQEKIKFNSIKLYFVYSNKNNNKIKKENIIKEYNEEMLDKYELGINSPVIFTQKLIVKYKTGKISFNKIEFTLKKKKNILYSIDLPNEFEKTIYLNGTNANIFNIEYPKPIRTVGINQLNVFEYKLKKHQIENAKIVEYKHTFIGEQMTKNVIDSQKKKYNDMNKNKEVIDKNKNALIYIITSDKTEEWQSTIAKIDSTPTPATFYYYDENEKIMKKSENSFEFLYNDFESKIKKDEECTFKILVKFTKGGIYKLKLNLKYWIIHDEVDIKLEFENKEFFYFKVLDAFSFSNKITNITYLTIPQNDTEVKEYLTDSDIKMNLICKNLTEEDIQIKDILVNLNTSNGIKINSTVKDIIDSQDLDQQIKDQILNILQGTNYYFPYNIKFTEDFSGSVGVFKIIWTNKSLNEYAMCCNEKNFNFLNENEFSLPELKVNKIKIKFDYDYTINDNQEIILNIKLSNITENNKKISVYIDKNNENNYIVYGMTKFNLNLKNNEAKKINIKLFILQTGDIKLPDVIVKELDKSDKIICSNYYSPEKIIVQ